MEQFAALDPTGKLLLGLLAVTFLVLIGYLVVRLATGHLREDFMTPREAMHTYFGPGDDTPVSPNGGRAWILLFVSMALMGVMLLIVHNFH